MRVLIAAVLALSGAASAQVYVNPYVTKDGTYVEGHHRTAPNSTRSDNFGSQGNTNPYTGQQGSVNPYAQPNPYQAPRQPVCGIASNGQYVCR